MFLWLFGVLSEVLLFGKGGPILDPDGVRLNQEGGNYLDPRG